MSKAERRPIPKRKRGHYRLKNDRIDALLIDRVYADYYLTTEGIADEYDEAHENEPNSAVP